MRRDPFGYWLLYIPEKRIVTFADLFARPDEARSFLATAARTLLATALAGIRVNGHTAAERAAEEARIDATVARVTSPEAARHWLVSLDLFGRCRPGLLVTLDSVESGEGERAALSLEIAGTIADAMRPEYVAAFRAMVGQ